MNFLDHVKLTPKAIIETFKYNHNFIKLPKKLRTIFIVGSGSSYSQALYLSKLFNTYSYFKAIACNPYSFVKYSNFQSNDIFLHFSQETKRNDNLAPLKFVKQKGGRAVLFTTKPDTPIAKNFNEVYYYVPEKEKILVASMSYGSGYAVALKYFNAQMSFFGYPVIKYSLNTLEALMKKSLKSNFKFKDVFTVYLYSGFGESIAIEGALKANECFLQDSESYEIKHYSHGKHFVSYNNQRIFNVIYNEKDIKLVKLYQNTIFEKHHIVNYLKSNLKSELAVFEWLIKMLVFTAQAMKEKKIELENIPVREKIRIPHRFYY